MTAKDLNPYNVYKAIHLKTGKKVKLFIRHIEEVYIHLFICNRKNELLREYYPKDVFLSHFEIIENLTEKYKKDTDALQPYHVYTAYEFELDKKVIIYTDEMEIDTYLYYFVIDERTVPNGRIVPTAQFQHKDVIPNIYQILKNLTEEQNHDS